MPRGLPSGRQMRLAEVTREAKRVLLETKDWPRTKEHLNYWIRAKYAVSRLTVEDYTDTAASRLMSDKDTKGLLI